MDRVLRVLRKWSRTPQGREVIKKATMTLVNTVGAAVVKAAPIVLLVAALAVVGYGVFHLVSDN